MSALTAAMRFARCTMRNDLGRRLPPEAVTPLTGATHGVG
jgi:hypothetical protein